MKARRLDCSALANAAAAQDLSVKVNEKKDVALLKRAISLCTTFQRTGVVLAWLLTTTSPEVCMDSVTLEFIEAWHGTIAKHKSASKRSRGATFPLRLGELQELVEVLQFAALTEVVVEAFVSTWSPRAWAMVMMWALNRLAGFGARPQHGPWTIAEKSAFASLLAAAERRSVPDAELVGKTEESWQKDVDSRQVGYNGEELSTCFELSLEQVLPAFPPAEHGGSIDCMNWIGIRTQRFLSNPELLLKNPQDVVLPRMPGKVHIRSEDRLPLALELVNRNVCCWVPLEKVYSVNGVRVLDGLFGVKKQTTLADGRPILRLIMNLTGSNATQIQLEGGCSSLPSITTWQSIVLDGAERLSLHQSDMCNAFYLFRIPPQWSRHLAFNLLVDGKDIGCQVGTKFALATSVIPMGWLNSVGIMQEISERLLGSQALSVSHRIARGYSLPPWMSKVLEWAKEEDKSWWHVYLDNFASGERVKPPDSGDSALRCHQAAEQAWEGAGVVSSEKKRLSQAARITELGAEVDGEQGTLGVPTGKLLGIIQGTLWMIAQKYLQRKTVQVMAGRWVFALQFRRPAMGFLQKTWEFVGGKTKMGDVMRKHIKAEFLSLVLAAPLFHCNLVAKICPQLVCSDASEKGGSVDFAMDLTDQGRDFLQAMEKLEAHRGSVVAPILVVSMFNGIGGCFRCYDLVSIAPKGRIAIELDDAGNRISQRRWPGLVVVKDVRSVTRELVKSWSVKYLDVEEVHLWAGWPCVDLSSVKFGRQNLEGPQSSLFYEIPRVRNLIQQEFGEQVIVRYVLENVASMDESAAVEISQMVGVVPYRLDCSDAVPMRRPRYAWTSETLEGSLPDIKVVNRRYWKDLSAEATYPETEQWLTPGHTWAGKEQGAIFPTCMKSIPRKVPPPRPAGLEKADAGTKRRWKEDSFRYPPYQYDSKFIITKGDHWRLLSASEKELLLGYGFNHTILAWSASRSKQDEVGFSDCRRRLLGDSFSCYSFVILAFACCRKFLPQLTYAHLAKRMGAAPGFLAHIRSVIPLQRSLQYGTQHVRSEVFERGNELMNRLMLRKTNHTGSDIRVLTGEVFTNKAFPRESVSASWWTWTKGFTSRWKNKSHINVLELEMVLLAIKFQIQRFRARDMRIFQLTDSYVNLSVTSKGRSSSRQLTRVLNSISAHLLAHGLQLIMAHVDSAENPSDEGSREGETQASRWPFQPS